MTAASGMSAITRLWTPATQVRGGQLEAGPIEFLTLAVMAGVTLWRKDLLTGLFAALVVFFACNGLFG